MRVTVTQDVRATTSEVWLRLTDWPSHGRWVPLTRVRVVGERSQGLGARFTGRTGVGWVAFNDPMEVVGWRPPSPRTAGRCTVRKLGRWVRGSAHFEVLPVAADRTRVVWTEDVDLLTPRLRVLAPLTRFATRRAFARMLRLAAGDIELGSGRHAEANAGPPDRRAGAADPGSGPR